VIDGGEAGVLTAAITLSMLLTPLLMLPQGQLYFHILLQIIAGVSTFFLARRLGVSPLAACLGARAPWRLPAWAGRLLAGDSVVQMMTRSRGSSNAKARRELDWTLAYPSWRQGFATGLAQPAVAKVA